MADILPETFTEKLVFKAMKVSGGERGIRTLGSRKGSTVFETAPFDRSGISPIRILLFRQWSENALQRYLNLM
jgi:hypothetical protein